MDDIDLENEKKKLVIGLYGEMQLAMKLHALGWQVHRGYIDEGIDFVISRYYCKSCKKISLNASRTFTMILTSLKNKGLQCFF